MQRGCSFCCQLANFKTPTFQDIGRRSAYDQDPPKNDKNDRHLNHLMGAWCTEKPLLLQTFLEAPGGHEASKVSQDRCAVHAELGHPMTALRKQPVNGSAFWD